MMKRANFLAAQDKECLPEQEQVTVFTPTEIAKFKRELSPHLQTENANTNRRLLTSSC